VEFVTKMFAISTLPSFFSFATLTFNIALDAHANVAHPSAQAVCSDNLRLSCFHILRGILWLWLQSRQGIAISFYFGHFKIV
jgi:hypothetical protein